MKKQADIFTAVLAQYADGPAQLEAALIGIGESDLDRAQSADTWTIRQIVHHIADGDDIWKICIKAALGNSEGMFSLQWYWDRPQTEWAERWGYASRSIRPSLDLLIANRQHIMELIQQAPDACQKSIWLKRLRKRKVRITVADVLEIQAGHVVEHINEIRTIRQTYGV